MVATGLNGTFTAKVKPGIYDIFVARIGFAPNCGEVKVEQGKQAQYNAVLEISEFNNTDEFAKSQ